MKRVLFLLIAAVMLFGILAPAVNAAIITKPRIVLGDDPIPLPPPPIN
jgi:hypothetical protein